MPDTIRDGKGNGYLAEVDSEGHLHITAANVSMLTHRSTLNASAYGLSTPFLTITTTGGRILYIKNNESSKDFHVSDIRLNWNGGDTTGIKTLQMQIAFGDTVPDTNIITGAMGVLNKKSNNSVDADVLYWDEVGSGMTGGSLGSTGLYIIQEKGTKRYEINGAIILGINNTLAINLKGEEAGLASINLLGYFEESE